MTRTASSTSMDQVHNGANRGHVRCGKHAVAEIEDVSGAPLGPRQDVAHLAVALGAGSEQRGRLEVSLDRAIADARPRGVERQAPVNADHVSPRGGKVLEKRGGSGPE